MRRTLGVAMLLGTCLALPVAAQRLPPAPSPTENPPTEQKRVLGKILFWDEQLSSDGTVACGSCHRPGAGGADGRIAVNPGPDGAAPSPDDIIGSPGVVLTDASGQPVEDDVFGNRPQVTGRAAMAVVNAAFVPQAFWDGRAGPVFFDPDTGAQSIAGGGALENQALAPILNDVEMAHQGRTWSDVTGKLARSAPLAEATDVPADVASVLATGVTYAELFRTAFGDERITAERIAFAIATYERTLIADQTPWDRFIQGDTTALTPGQAQGWNFFRGSPCATCHRPPFFTDNSFRNIGLRPPTEDPGRQDVTGLFQDRGRFKVPTLRNVGLKETHMHNGRLPDVNASVLWYRPNNPDRFLDNLDPLLPVGVPPQVLPGLVDFIQNGLTDPRVAAETFPFDRPTLHAGRSLVLRFGADTSTLAWPPLAGVAAYGLYRGDLDALRDADGDGAPDAGYGTCLATIGPGGAPQFVDDAVPEPGRGFFYLKTAIDGQGAEVGAGATGTGAPRVPDGCS